MSNHRPSKEIARPQAAKNRRGLSSARLWVFIGLGFGAFIFAAAVFILLFGGAILNGYGKKRMERAVAEALPGCALRIGKLDYAFGPNRLTARSVALSAENSTIKVGRISLTGVRWARLLWGTASWADVLAKAALDATTIDVEFPRSHYGIRCAHLRASVPASELVAEAAELGPLIGDDELFAADAFRTTRFRALVPECRVSGLAYGDLIRGMSYRARSVYVSRPSFDALVDRNKPVKPFMKSPLMVNEALAAIRQPLRIDGLTITDGSLRYAERMTAGTGPGVLSFTAVKVSAEGIANRGGASAVILIRAQGRFMDAGLLKVLMTMPVASPDLSLHYSGSLGAMDLTRLDAFLDISEHTRIKSGSAKAAAFDITVTGGRARGHVRATYKGLKIAFLNRQTGSEKGWGNRIASFVANVFKIRHSNAPDASGPMKEGKVGYMRKPDDTFLQFVWFSLRSGVLDVVAR